MNRTDREALAKRCIRLAKALVAKKEEAELLVQRPEAVAKKIEKGVGQALDKIADRREFRSLGDLREEISDAVVKVLGRGYKGFVSPSRMSDELNDFVDDVTEELLDEFEEDFLDGGDDFGY